MSVFKYSHLVGPLEEGIVILLPINDDESRITLPTYTRMEASIKSRQSMDVGANKAEFRIWS